MTEVRFEFGGMCGVSGSFAFSREPFEGGQLRVEFGSIAIRRSDGSRKVFLLEFNNIGRTEPLDFLESLDQGYLTDKLSNLSGRSVDLFRTAENVRRVLDEEGSELEPEQIGEAERLIDLAAETFAGDHRSSCEGLIRGLQRTGLPCFQDDPYHLIGAKRTLENLIFERRVWPAVLQAIDDKLSLNLDIADPIEAVVEGRPLPGEGPDWPEPEIDF
jgi:hypothetical protein